MGGSADKDAHSSGGSDSGEPALNPAEHRRITKEVQAITRKLERLDAQVEKLDASIAAHDQSDFEGLAELSAERTELLDHKDELEMEWLELSEQLE